VGTENKPKRRLAFLSATARDLLYRTLQREISPTEVDVAKEKPSTPFQKPFVNVGHTRGVSGVSDWELRVPVGMRNDARTGASRQRCAPTGLLGAIWLYDPVLDLISKEAEVLLPFFLPHSGGEEAGERGTG
jgi:hypothetical protein